MAVPSGWGAEYRAIAARTRSPLAGSVISLSIVMPVKSVLIEQVARWWASALNRSVRSGSRRWMIWRPSRWTEVGCASTASLVNARSITAAPVVVVVTPSVSVSVMVFVFNGFGTARRVATATSRCSRLTCPSASAAPIAGSSGVAEAIA
jgi:hypothetical protein